MTDDKTCVVEKKGIGKVCTGEDGISLVIEKDVIEKLKSGITANLPYMDIETRKLASQRLAELDRPDAMKKVIPFNDVRMIGFLKSDDERFDDPTIAISFNPEISRSIGIAGSYINFAVDKEGSKRLESALPKNVKRTTRMEDFWKSV